jgi:hypothetical protein
MCKLYLKLLIVLCAIVLSCSEKNELSSDNEEQNKQTENQIDENDVKDESSLLDSELRTRLADDSIYVVEPVIYVARGGKRHGVKMDEERIKSFFFGWGKNSVNPLLLQMGVSFNAEKLKIVNIELPMTNSNDEQEWYNYIQYFTGYRGDRVFDPTMARKSYKLTDENGKPTGKYTSIDQDKFRILLMDEGPTGGYAGGVPHRAVVLNVNGSTRNIIGHEVAHVLGLNHIDTKKEVFAKDSINWVMNPIIYDRSVFVTADEGATVRSVLKQYLNNKKLRLTNQIKKVGVGNSLFKAEDLNKAWKLLKTKAYFNKNRDLEE